MQTFIRSPQSSFANSVGPQLAQFQKPFKHAVNFNAQLPCTRRSAVCFCVGSIGLRMLHAGFQPDELLQI